ncbi:hypothetical protein P7C70_g475, partial [Phenoliferia sp. Uapishka_3]
MKGKEKSTAREGGAVVRVREARSPQSHERCPTPQTQHARPPPSTNFVDDDDEEDDFSFCCCSQDSTDQYPRLSRHNGSSLHRGDDVDEDEDDSGALSSSFSSEDSTPSTLPSLSPSRAPLFDESGDEEDASWSDDNSSSPVTPRSYSESSFISLRARKTSVPTLATTDPLLSPPTPHATAVPAQLPGRRCKSRSRSATKMQLPNRDSTKSQTSHASLFNAVTASTPSLPPSSPTSLLTKSLRSLVHLPNLILPALPPLLSRPTIPNVNATEQSRLSEDPLFEWSNSAPWGENIAGQGFGGDEQERERGLAFVTSCTPRKVARRLSSVEDAGEFLGNTWDSGSRRATDSFDDFEASSTSVQLQTFSPPPSPSRKRTTIPLPAPPPPPPPPSESPPLTASTSPPPPYPRLISNHRHLLMLTLELSMIHSGKINCPLRQRSVVLRKRNSSPGKSARGSGSALRWEIPRRSSSASS